MLNHFDMKLPPALPRRNVIHHDLLNDERIALMEQLNPQASNVWGGMTFLTWVLGVVFAVFFNS